MTMVALVIAASAWAGDLAVDNLTVSSDATIYGKMDVCLVAGTNSTGALATGGTITTNGNYIIHTFTNIGTTNFTVLEGSLNCEVLVVAGGGAGGVYAAGGGAGGGMAYTSSYSVSGNIAISNGSGGAAVSGTAPLTGGVGKASSFGTLTASGGAGGRPNIPGTGPGAGGVGVEGGGSGGASGIASTSAGLPGGIGTSYSISGLAYTYSGGGGGAGPTGYEGGTGGISGGGQGGKYTGFIPGTNGTANTGGGGGGAWYNTFSGTGGSGIVIVRYQTTSNSYVSTLTFSSNGISQISASGANVLMGKVGIGTNNPTEKLHVAGNLRVDGTSIVSAVVLGGVPITNWSSLASGVLMASNNLSDIADQAAARANLGLGSVATNEAGAFLSPNGDGSQITGITATQVGALSTNAGALIAANNLSDIANQATARANLGLGTAATNEASAFLSTAGGVVNGDISLVAPAGDIPMGVYTNQ